MPGPHAGDCAHKGLFVASSVLVPQLDFLVTTELSEGLAKGHRVQADEFKFGAWVSWMRFLQAKAR